MKSKIIESIFEEYLNKEKTNYALLISGKWGSGKTFLWKNILAKKAKDKGFKPVYISLNGISRVEEIEGIILGSLLPFSDKFQDSRFKSVINLGKNLINAAGKIVGRGTQLIDLTKGVKISFDVSKSVFCFDDLERCSIEPKNILGLINEYTEHKNAKVIICSAEEEIDNDLSYNKIKEKVIGRVLSYNSNYNDLFSSFVENETKKEFGEFLISKKKLIISFFKKHDIQNLRTFEFYLENIERIFKYIKDESEVAINNMLYFTAIISNEFKKGELTVANLKDTRGIDDSFMFLAIDDLIVDNKFTPVIQGKKEDVKKEKSYSELFNEKYLSDENDKIMYSFSPAIYEFILSGYFDVEKLKDEIKKRYGNNYNAEDQVFDKLMGYNFRVLENEDLETSIKQILEFAEQGKYNMYSYQTIYHNLLYHKEIGSFEIDDKDLISILSSGLDISKETSDINQRQMENIRHFKEDKELNKIENKILELHNEKSSKEKSDRANKIFEVLDKELNEVNDFITDELRNGSCLFEFIDANTFFTKLISLKNKKLLIFSNALKDIYHKKGYVQFPEKELPFFKLLRKLLYEYNNSNKFKNPKNIIQKELISRIDEVISQFEEQIKIRGK